MWKGCLVKDDFYVACSLHIVYIYSGSFGEARCPLTIVKKEKYFIFADLDMSRSYDALWEWTIFITSEMDFMVNLVQQKLHL